jgi:LysR family transcriptional regulator, benzoate and cis,cis-muconate-responsive activator of ben and cat genes
MEIRQLRRFLVLAEELNFGRAAARLHIAQPALSQDLKALERELGLRLLDRTHTHVALTAAGRRLREDAVRIVEAHDATARSMEEFRSRPSATLHLGVAVGVRYPLLARLLNGIGPDTRPPEVTVHPVGMQDGVQKLLASELDAVFVHSEPPRDDRFGTLTLESEPMGVALPITNRLARLDSVRPTDLSGEALIWLERDGDPLVRERVLSALVEAGMVPGPHRWSPSIATTMSLVAAGLGVSFKVPHQVVPGDPPGVVWRPLTDVSLPMPTVLVWVRQGATPLVRQLVSRARAEVGHDRSSRHEPGRDPTG